MALDSNDIHRIAELARLKLDPEREASLAQELNRVLGLFDALAAAPVDDLAPLAHPSDMRLRLRPDVVTEADQHEAFQAIAPAVSGGLYLVPKVIE